MSNIKYIVSKNNSKNIDVGKFDSDKSLLAFEYYIRYLHVMKCTDICIIHSKNDKLKVDSLSKDVIEILERDKKDKNSKFITYDDYIDKYKVVKNLVGAISRPRIGLGFKYDGFYWMLEVDTLLGTSWVNKLNYENSGTEKMYDGIDMTHSIGNLGLVPYKSGNKGSWKDYPKYKFSETEKELVEELNGLMFYGDDKTGIYSINDESAKEDVYRVISEREAHIISLIPEITKYF